MTEIMITCGKCDPEAIREIQKERTICHSEGQTTVWTCMHVQSFRATYPRKYVRIK